MNIAIDITPLSSGHAARGVGVYTKNLIEALKQYEPKHSYSFFTRGENVSKNVQIVHYPYFDPFFLTLPWKKKIPTVVTVHDLIPLVFPDKFPAGIRGRVKWNMQKMALRQADAIITVSQCSKKDVQQIVRIPEDKIYVIYSAATPGIQANSSKTIQTKLKTIYHVPNNYMLYVGDVNWNKNVPGLLKAFASYVAIKKDACLMLVGGAFKKDDMVETKQIRQVIHEAHLENNVLLPGFVSQEDLAGLYTMADCLIEPSFYEGFGLPVLEAMASGCPVIVADNSSLSEIAGPSMKFSADAVETMTSAMIAIGKLSVGARDKMIAEGIAWSKQFSWEKTAHETVSVYKAILEKA